MKLRHKLLTTGAFVLLVALAGVSGLGSAPYRNARLPGELRVDDLLEQLIGTQLPERLSCSSM